MDLNQAFLHSNPVNFNNDNENGVMMTLKRRENKNLVMQFHLFFFRNFN